jgi:hypothetical protein
MKTLLALLVVVGLLLCLWLRQMQSDFAVWDDAKRVGVESVQARVKAAGTAQEDRGAAQGGDLLDALRREREANEEVVKECRKWIERLRQKPYRFALNDAEKQTLTFLETTRLDYERFVAESERAERIRRLKTPKPRDPGLAYKAVVRQHINSSVGFIGALSNHGLVTNSAGPSLLVECGLRATNDGGAVGECLLLGFPRDSEIPDGQMIEFHAHTGTMFTRGKDGSTVMLIYSPEDEGEPKAARP